MDYTIALGVWAVTIAGPCVVSWLAGDMAGSARTRRLYEKDQRIWDLSDGTSALRVEEWLIAGSVHPLAAQREAPPAGSAAHKPAPFEREVEEAQRRQRRREAFVAMPDLASLRADAEAIRLADNIPYEVVRSDPIVDARLRQYDGSINELGRLRTDRSLPHRHRFVCE